MSKFFVVISAWNMEYVMNESFDLCGFGQEYVIILVVCFSCCPEIAKFFVCLFVYVL
jgi:hypothetical protein